MQLTISCPWKITATITSSIHFDIDEHEVTLLKEVIPGATFTSNTRRPDIIINHIPSNHTKIIQHSNGIERYDNRSNKLPIEIRNVMYILVHQYQCDQNMFSVDSVCISNQDKCILLVWDVEDQNSIIALYLIWKYSFNLLSYNKTLITFDKLNQINAVAGTTTSKLSDNQYEKNERIITDIVIVKPQNQENQYHKITSVQSILHQVYLFFIDKKNQDIILCDGWESILHHVHHSVVNYLTQSLIKSFDKIAVHSIWWSLEFIASSIEKIK